MSFLADTGADVTMIMPMDLVRFSVTFPQLQNACEIYGVGGKAEAFKEDAIVTFVEPGFGLRIYTVEIQIMKPNQHIMNCPSLLGRDIMSKWNIAFDRSNNRISARVARADHTIKFTKQMNGLEPLLGVRPPAPVI